MKSPSSFLLMLSLFSIFLSCSKSESTQVTRDQQVEEKAGEFFKTFADRNDWDKFCSFYREDVQFEDVILQLKLDSLWQFRRFYDWEGEGDNFKKLTPEQEHLTLYSLVANDSVAVGRGRINPFYYYDQLIDSDWGMEFTIWLYFDENLRIVKQVDWMEYDPLTMQSMLDRVEENGHEAIPDWLDLSR